MKLKMRYTQYLILEKENKPKKLLWHLKEYITIKKQSIVHLSDAIIHQEYLCTLFTTIGKRMHLISVLNTEQF